MPMSDTFSKVELIRGMARRRGSSEEALDLARSEEKLPGVPAFCRRAVPEGSRRARQEDRRLGRTTWSLLPTSVA